MYDYFDIHSHLNFEEYDADREAVIAELQAQKIATITVGTNLKTSQESVALAEKHENIFATIGLHPVDDPSGIFDEKAFEKLMSSKKVVAIGECGLDYARLPTDIGTEKKRQKELFEQQIAFAIKYDKPLMIHCRDAYIDAIPLLSSKKKEFGDKLRGNFHFFTSPVEIAKQCLDIGFTISFTGPITFAKQYEEVVGYIPLEKMMAETDSPYATPAPYRGKRNNPLYVKEVVAAIAAIKQLPLDSVQKKLLDTGFHLFLSKI